MVGMIAQSERLEKDKVRCPCQFAILSQPCNVEGLPGRPGTIKALKRTKSICAMVMKRTGYEVADSRDLTWKDAGPGIFFPSATRKF